jgi:hypothetical protein
MPGEHDGWSGAAGAGALGQHVADCIRSSAQAKCFQPPTEFRGARGFLERRRGDLANGFLLRESPGVVRLQRIQDALQRILRRGNARSDEEHDEKAIHYSIVER